MRLKATLLRTTRNRIALRITARLVSVKVWARYGAASMNMIFYEASTDSNGANILVNSNIALVKTFLFTYLLFVCNLMVSRMAH